MLKPLVNRHGTVAASKKALVGRMKTQSQRRGRRSRQQFFQLFPFAGLVDYCLPFIQGRGLLPRRYYNNAVDNTPNSVLSTTFEIKITTSLAGDRGADGFGPGGGGAISHSPAEQVVGHFSGVGAFVFGDVGRAGINGSLNLSSRAGWRFCFSGQPRCSIGFADEAHGAVERAVVAVGGTAGDAETDL